MIPTTLIADFHVGCRSEMHAKLNATVAQAHIAARTAGQGVLVTRHDFNRFSVALSHDVPFGHTREKDQASRNQLKPIVVHENRP